MNKVLLSGVKPTGRPHIGNYFGAMKQFVELQNDYKSYFMIADYHALNLIHNKAEMTQLIADLAIDYLAIGLDPNKAVIFQQSAIQAHTELSWIFDTMTTMPYLMRAHAFKDAEAKNKEINVGTFNYPMLMAADILLYEPDVVPVGQDQKQHVEIARDIAQKFNNTFGDTFKLPEPMIQKEVAIIPGTDGQKMSKSYNNTIELFATDEEIEEAVMGIATDSKDVNEPKNPENDNVFKLHKIFTTGNEFDQVNDGYINGGLSYSESKKILIKNIKSFISPLRVTREKISKNLKYVKDVLESGRKNANGVASIKLDEVKEKIGVII